MILDKIVEDKKIRLVEHKSRISMTEMRKMKDIIDGAIVGSHFINLMEENQYDLDVAKAYIQTFKTELK